LVGNIDIPGGLLRQRRAPLREMPDKILDDAAKRGLSEPRIDETSEGRLSIDNDETRNFVENVIGRRPYEINCLFLPSRNEYLLSPLSKKMEEAIQNIPLVVSFASFLDELNEFVDLVLPDTSYFEKWQEHQASQLSKVPVVGINQPIVKPLYQTKPSEEVILALAKNIDLPSSQNFPWRSFKELLDYRLEGLFEANRGGVFASPLEEAQLRLLEERGWWVPQHASLDSFMKDLGEKGGWQDPSYHFNERSFIYQNPSRRFEFQTFPQSQEFLPQFSGDESEYPFLLYLYELPFASDENGANMPWHQETIGFRFRLNWKIWMEINHETAEKLGIHDKEIVWIESPHGRIKAVAKIFPGIIPDAVAIPVGKKEDFPDQKKLERENDPLVLVEGAYAEGRGKYSRHATRVKIFKYTE
jgi:anaerobic selenocysteine-containing dehydrogenase